MDTRQANVERFNTIASEWDSDPGRVLMAQKVARAMRTALSPTGREQALEFGAGTGLVTLLMAPTLAHVTALDSSAGMLDVLRQKCESKQLTQVETIEGMVPDQLPDTRYDLIYSSMTMHHVDDVPALLKTLADHVKPGGRIALADLDAEDGGFHHEAKGVVHHGFARDTFGNWLRDAGFADVRFSTAFTVSREADDGTVQDYPIFLAIASQPDS
ncbi:MAG: class I SAM-dependent methyltransferase [Rhodanobacter sp.]|nr:MAG: class I SAM-dependent methyltransferase [Rhodanobacter sp.]TAL98061.1 MAG: class I SAM-dependent methyltransferase [Rhodanobacter sp.]TAM38485.1 MAG: class I SAM-dependent methyltransferase [Rhodanobacter sp.]TAN27051.1 MAG: class I SAM-dependent methyltransferase [Rhodanobacter sp.]